MILSPLSSEQRGSLPRLEVVSLGGHTAGDPVALLILDDDCSVGFGAEPGEPPAIVDTPWTVSFVRGEPATTTIIRFAVRFRGLADALVAACEASRDRPPFLAAQPVPIAPMMYEPAALERRPRVWPSAPIPDRVRRRLER